MTTISITRDDEKATAIIKAIGQIDDGLELAPIVRCKDCKYWQDNNGGYPREECRWGKDETPDGDDFCSYGERRSEP
jgi:hypothetical protein